MIEHPPPQEPDSDHDKLDLGGIKSDLLSDRLRKLRVNDVYVKIVDADTDETHRLRAYDVRYDSVSDSIVVLAYKHFR